MKNRREEMRQLWCQDGSPVNLHAGDSYDADDSDDGHNGSWLTYQVGGGASLQQFDKFDPSISSSSSPGAPVGAFANPGIASFQTSSSDQQQQQQQQPLVSPLHPALPQFSLTPLNIAEVGGANVWTLDNHKFFSRQDNGDLYDESRDSESPISDVEITS